MYKHLVIDLKSGELLNKLSGDYEPQAIAITPDGNQLISGGSSSVDIYDLTTYKKFKTIETKHRSLRTIAVSPDNNLFAVSFENQIAICNFRTENDVSCFAGFYFGVKKLNFTCDGKLVIGSDRHSVYIWDTESRNLLKTLPIHYEVKGFSPDGRQVYSVCKEGSFLWDPNQWIYYNPGHTQKITSLRFVNNGKQVVSASLDGSCIFWDIITGKPIDLSYPLLDLYVEGYQNWEHINPLSAQIRALTVTQDGNYFMTASVLGYDKVCCLRDIASRKSIITFVIKNWSARQMVCIIADNKKAVITDYEKIGIWSLTNGKKTKALTGHRELINDAVLFANDKKLITVSRDKTAIIWELAKGVILRTLKGHNGSVYSVAVSPDEKSAITASADGTCRIWDLESGKCLKVLSGHSAGVNFVTISPNGKLAISGSDDKSCILWNLENGGLLKRLEGHLTNVKSVIFVNEGSRVISFSEKTCILWDVTGGNQLEGYTLEEGIACYAINENILVLGSNSGEVIFIKLGEQ
jgi:WD40 repeat protein